MQNEIMVLIGTSSINQLESNSRNYLQESATSILRRVSLLTSPLCASPPFVMNQAMDWQHPFLQKALLLLQEQKLPQHQVHQV